MFIWIVIILLTVFLDQLTKYLTVFFLKPIDTLPIIKDVIHLTYVENPGAAFGMMKDARWLFMTVSTVAIIGLSIYLFKKKSQTKLENIALCFIIGGGIGNMIDRVALGYVVDMIDFRLIDFAVFNVADSFVCIGAGLLMLFIILTGVKEWKAEKNAKTSSDTNPDTPDDLDDDLGGYAYITPPDTDPQASPLGGGGMVACDRDGEGETSESPEPPVGEGAPLPSENPSDESPDTNPETPTLDTVGESIALPTDTETNPETNTPNEEQTHDES